MSATTALYYPFIHPREINNLKTSLLYWDRVRRIVPNSVRTDNGAAGDYKDLQTLADHGLLVATSPSEYEEAAAQKFMARLGSDTAKYVLSAAAARDMQDEGRLHIEKMAPAMRSQLAEAGLAHVFGEWMSMHGEVATFYMHSLAAVMSEAIGAPLLADSESHANAGEALLFAEPNGIDRVEYLFHLGIELPSPASLAGVPLERIIRFSRERADERAAFREALEAILDQSRTIKDPNQLHDYISSRAVTIKMACTDLRKAIDEINAIGAMDIARITVPASLPIVAGMMGLPPIPAATLSVVGLAWGLVEWSAKRRGKLRQTRQGDPYHYVLTVRNDFIEGRRGL